jgi:glycosyltransferase involved in cell wall biosynthesis
MSQKNLASFFELKNTPKGNLISIILPLYNEEGSIEIVLDELYKYLTGSKYRFEITFIDDFSTDSSFKKVVEQSKKAPVNIKVSIARLAKNSGSHVAITAGLNIAQGNFIIIMASDGQDPASVVGQLITEWENGNELVLASRIDNLDHSFISNFFSNCAWRLMNWSTNLNMPKKGCDLLGLDKKVLDAFNKMDERNTTFIFRIFSLGYKQKEIEYVKRARVAGKSNWTFLKKLSIMADAISGFSSRPLKLIINFGVVVFLLLIARWMVVIFKIYFLNESPSELSVILNTVLTALAIQVLILGFIGDYIWRILDETRKRPLYEISEVDGQIFEHKSSEV